MVWPHRLQASGRSYLLVDRGVLRIVLLNTISKQIPTPGEKLICAGSFIDAC